MKVFASTDHDSFYPVGAASVVVAKNEKEARKLLDKALREKGLDPDKASPSTEKPYTLVEVKPNSAVVLVDGNY